MAGVGLAVLLAACGGGGSKASTAPPSTAASAAANGASTAGSSTAATVVAVSNPKEGEILANAKDITLYTYTADKGGKSACTGACLTYWPPLLLPSGTTQPVAGPGVSGLGTVTEPGGTQVTYHGMPLYTYIGDKAPNQTTGQGVVDSLGTWYVVSLSGSASAPTTAAGGAVTPTTTPASSQTAPPQTTAPQTTPPSTAPSGGGVSY